MLGAAESGWQSGRQRDLDSQVLLAEPGWLLVICSGSKILLDFHTILAFSPFPVPKLVL